MMEEKQLNRIKQQSRAAARKPRDAAAVLFGLNKKVRNTARNRKKSRFLDFEKRRSNNIDL